MTSVGKAPAGSCVATKEMTFDEGHFIPAVASAQHHCSEMIANYLAWYISDHDKGCEPAAENLNWSGAHMTIPELINLFSEDEE